MKIFKIILLFGFLSSSAFANSLGEGEPDCTAINGSSTQAGGEITTKDSPAPRPPTTTIKR